MTQPQDIKFTPPRPNPIPVFYSADDVAKSIIAAKQADQAFSLTYRPYVEIKTVKL